MQSRFARLLCFLAAVSGMMTAGLASAGIGNLPDTIDHVKPSIVAVGTYEATRRPPAMIRGTGFVVADGSVVATNAHVLPDSIDNEKREYLAVFQREGKRLRVSHAQRLAVDGRHDVVLLKFSGPRLPALSLADGDSVREGQLVGFTGFPIGAVLGLRPVTHRGIVSSITPIVLPKNRASELNAESIAALRHPYNVYQLDATAYPGNSGSPLFDVDTGKVLGIINSVFVKKTKEAALDNPSGISYAIPVHFLRDLLQRVQRQ